MYAAIDNLSADTQTQLDDLIRISREMRAAAAGREWGCLAALEQRRSTVISRFFASPHTPIEGAVVATCLQQMLDLDRDVIDMAEDGLKALAGELAGFERGRRASRAYAGVG